MALSPLDVYTVKVANFIANAIILSLLDRNTYSEAGKLYSGREVCSQPDPNPRTFWIWQLNPRMFWFSGVYGTSLYVLIISFTGFCRILGSTIMPNIDIMCDTDSNYTLHSLEWEGGSQQRKAWRTVSTISILFIKDSSGVLSDIYPSDYFLHSSFLDEWTEL
mgnify:CR=1 FL=1